MKLFYDAKCFDSAHVVKEWPWGFRMKTEARFWIETTKHGDRFVKQTLNLKNGRWCKPKKSTYEAVMVLTQDDDNKMSYISIGKYDSQNWMAEALEIIDELIIKKNNDTTPHLQLAIEDSFNAAISEKMSGALDDYRIQVAQTMFNAPEEASE